MNSKFNLVYEQVMFEAAGLGEAVRKIDEYTRRYDELVRIHGDLITENAIITEGVFGNLITGCLGAVVGGLDNAFHAGGNILSSFLDKIQKSSLLKKILNILFGGFLKKNGETIIDAVESEDNEDEDEDEDDHGFIWKLLHGLFESNESGYGHVIQEQATGVALSDKQFSTLVNMMAKSAVKESKPGFFGRILNWIGGTFFGVIKFLAAAALTIFLVKNTSFGQGILNSLSGLVSKFLEKSTDSTVKKFENAAVSAAQRSANIIGNEVDQKIASAQNAIGVSLGEVKKTTNDIINTVDAKTDATLQKIEATGNKLQKNAEDASKNIGKNAFKGVVGGVAETGKEMGKKAVNTVGTVVKAVTNPVGTLAEHGVKTIKKLYQNQKKEKENKKK